MLEFLGKILPIDGFQATLTVSLPSDYLQSLIHLYQPLIGIEAVNLYQTLLCEAEVQQSLNDKEQTHHTLMNYLNISLAKLYEARIKLEGIGLLNTYRTERETMTLYTYELVAPFSPNEFFNDIMLSQLLYRQIGKTKFETLERFYRKHEHESAGENVTVTFDEVFQTFQPTEKMEEFPNESKKLSQGIQTDQIEMTWLEQLLRRKNIPLKNIVTDENVRVLSQLKHLYDLELYELEKAIIWALNEENKLDIQQLQAACHDLFTAKYNVANVQLTYKGDAPIQRANDRPKSQREQLIERLETISPKQLLEDLSAGNNASEQDMKMISDIMIKQGLPIPVMNVLVYYVLLQSNMKLSKQYMEKIASHWSRAKLKTAREAMDFALQEVKPVNRQYKRTTATKQKSAEVIPDWFKNRKNEPTDESSNTFTKQDLDKQREMEAILQKYSNKN